MPLAEADAARQIGDVALMYRPRHRQIRDRGHAERRRHRAGENQRLSFAREDHDHPPAMIPGVHE
jgi:hypothetical protein